MMEMLLCPAARFCHMTQNTKKWNKMNFVFLNTLQSFMYSSTVVLEVVAVVIVVIVVVV